MARVVKPNKMSEGMSMKLWQPPGPSGDSTEKPSLGNSYQLHEKCSFLLPFPLAHHPSDETKQGLPCLLPSNPALPWGFASSRCHLLKPSSTHMMTHVYGGLTVRFSHVPSHPSASLVFLFPGSLLFSLHFPSLCHLLVQ